MAALNALGCSVFRAGPLATR